MALSINYKAKLSSLTSEIESDGSDLWFCAETTTAGRRVQCNRHANDLGLSVLPKFSRGYTFFTTYINVNSLYIIYQSAQRGVDEGGD